MRENRRHHRVKMPAFPPKLGRIAIDAKSPSIECRVVDLSSSGACLEITGQAQALPKRFEFFANGSRKKCNLVWRNGRRLGVSF
jgi:hypothetical protein